MQIQQIFTSIYYRVTRGIEYKHSEMERSELNDISERDRFLLGSSLLAFPLFMQSFEPMFPKCVEHSQSGGDNDNQG